MQDSFTSAAVRVLIALPFTAYIDLRTGPALRDPETFHGRRTVDNAWLVVQPLARPEDRPLRKVAIQEMIDVIVMRTVDAAQLDIAIGDRRATLLRGEHPLSFGTMSFSGGPMTYEGGECANADEALRDMLHGLRLA